MQQMSKDHGLKVTHRMIGILNACHYSNKQTLVQKDCAGFRIVSAQTKCKVDIKASGHFHIEYGKATCGVGAMGHVVKVTYHPSIYKAPREVPDRNQLLDWHRDAECQLFVTVKQTLQRIVLT